MTTWGPEAASVLIAGVALLVSVLTYRRTVRMTRRRQADQVGAWVTRDRMLHVRNASSTPIYQWSVRYLYEGKELGRTRVRPVIPPGDDNTPLTWNVKTRTAFEELKEATVESGQTRPAITEVRVELTFTDTYGRTWMRDAQGSLESLDTPVRAKITRWLRRWPLRS
ncbi:hypothetical protein [Aeromicrobium sp. CTD01-1L150]|uniref:hypothetical protein n=1 Tax=Aeromicrobium sp. CTD01-1L150 TaxID=3341830 RepID=UPI0035BEC6F2